MNKIELKDQYFALMGNNKYREIAKQIIKNGGGFVERGVTEKTNCVVVESFSGARGKKYLELRGQHKRVITYIPFFHCAGLDVKRVLKDLGDLNNSHYEYYLAAYYLYYSECSDVYKQDKVFNYVLKCEDSIIKEISFGDRYTALSRLIPVKEYDLDCMIKKGFIKGVFSNELIVVLDYWKYLMEKEKAKECTKLLDNYISKFDDECQNYLLDWKKEQGYIPSVPLAAKINHLFKQGQHGIYLAN